MRTGLIAKKLGMTRVFTEDGEHLPATLLQVEQAQVVAQRTVEKDGYTALQLGVGKRKVKNVSKAMRGHYAKAKVEPKMMVKEFRVAEDAMVPVGSDIPATHFIPGQYVDVAGISKGRGFSGGMRRHNFGGLEASHGVSISHRSHGSTGQCQDPGKVFKGKKMAGQYGNASVTVQNLTVISSDAETGVIVVRGAVPGSKGGYVFIRDAVKRAVSPDAPYPTVLKEEPEAAEEPGAEGENQAGVQAASEDKQEGQGNEA